MAEICALEPNGLDAISTFSGCGGSSLGYRMAGFRVLWASEFIDEARATYAANKAPYTTLDGRDIREVSGEEILETIGKAPGELDLLDGSPPCASFSTLGKREKGWGEVRKYSDKAQRSDDLFFEYARLIDVIKPRTFVAENVTGMVKGTALGYFKQILRRLKDAGDGYNVEARILDARWLGVPQARQRLIFVGVRKDLGLKPVHPRPNGWKYTLRDALVGMEGVHVEPETSCEGSRLGQQLRTLRPGERHKNPYQLMRCHWDKTPPTVCATAGDKGAAAACHPDGCRKFSVAETRRICGFPDDFILTGPYARQIERMGRAVPPVMMAAVARTVATRILAKAS